MRYAAAIVCGTTLLQIVPCWGAVKSDPKLQCATNALMDYSKATAALYQQNLDAGHFGISIGAELARRRLEEEYCIRYSQCSNAPSSMQFTLDFLVCLKDEAREHYKDP